MTRELIEPVARPIVAGLLLLVTLLLVLGTAIRDPRPHDLPVGIVAPPPMGQQLTGAFSDNAPGAFDFTTFATEADARAALDNRDVAAALIVGPAGPRLVVAGAAGDAVAGGITAAFTGAFKAQRTELPVEVVHPYAAGDPHGIVLFFLVLATLVSSVVVGALAALGTSGRSWRVPLGIVAIYAVSAGVVGGLVAAWLAGGFGGGLAGAMAVVALLSFAVGIVIAALARLLGPAGVALGALVVVFLGTGLVRRAARGRVPARRVPGDRGLAARRAGGRRPARNAVLRRRRDRRAAPRRRRLGGPRRGRPGRSRPGRAGRPAGRVGDGLTFVRGPHRTTSRFKWQPRGHPRGCPFALCG